MFVDGYVLAVPETRKADYVKEARDAAKVFRDHGALRVVECWGEDTPLGKFTSFPQAVKLEEGEVVCFAWMEFPDRETRDRCHETVMNDPRFRGIDLSKTPFDGKRMIFGGFSPIVDA